MADPCDNDIMFVLSVLTLIALIDALVPLIVFVLIEFAPIELVVSVPVDIFEAAKLTVLKLVSEIEPVLMVETFKRAAVI